ncbi:MAG: methyltransferase domain-containing protein [Thermoplasmata archaeon]
MTGIPSSEVVSDYDGFDFTRIWKGREKVTEVERAVLARSLDGVDGRRLLEIGTGFGRLTACLTSVGQEVVALDFDASALGRIPPSENGRPPIARVAGNLYHLPFVDGAFSGATMVRVLHHLTDPVAALTEIGRVLGDGSRLIVSYSAKPSVGTLLTDVQRALSDSSAPPFRSATFSRGAAIYLSGSPFPVIVGSRATFRSWVGSAGFEIETERVAGLEEYRFLRSLPSGHFVRWAETFGRAPGFPIRFAQLRLHRTGGKEWVPSDRILACPRCRAGLGWPGRDPIFTCPACGFFGETRHGVIDLRYVPEGTPRRSSSVAPAAEPR